MKNKPLRIGNDISSKELKEVDILNRIYEIEKIYKKNMGFDKIFYSQSFITRQTISRILYFNEIYKLIIDIPGVICEFGVQWGSGLVNLMNLRGIYEPFNHSRIIHGFDTFTGLKEVSKKDGDFVNENDFSVSKSFYEHLEELLNLHEKLSPISHIKKFQLHKGDAIITSKEWLKKNKHVIISMAIFDMDLYKPTIEVLKTIKPRLIKGSLIVFDELNNKFHPGETEAVKEYLGLNNLKIKKSKFQTYSSWVVI